MPARKGWIEDAGRSFFWTLFDAVPEEIAGNLSFGINDKRMLVFFEGFTPRDVLTVVSDGFLKSCNLSEGSWERVVKLPWPGEDWRPFDPKHDLDLPDVCFGWRHRESVICDGAAVPVEVTDERSGPSAMVADPYGLSSPPGQVSAPGRAPTGEKPAFLRRVMD